MASVEKFTKTATIHQIRHIERTAENIGNVDVDRERSQQNLTLTPIRDMSAFEYYKQRLSECHVFNRSDVVTTFGWVLTAPEDIPREKEDRFFNTAFEFLNERYGEKNCVSCVVHRDESGRSHMHYLAIPVVPDKKNGGEKVCCKEVINRKELKVFHSDLDKYMSSHGMRCAVYTGVTKAQGGNRTVKEMKRERSIERERARERTISRW